jgi:triosephosphate isomerase
MKYIVGNWKMNGDAALAQKLIAASKPSPHEVILCCPFTLLHLVQGISKGAQDCSPETHGAYTGDISASMLKQAGCEWVIVGHSERRHHHSETDALIARKAAAVISAGLKVIYCVGETLDERKAGNEKDVIKNQLSFFASHKPQATSHYLIAYEPVWAIGTGLTPTCEQIAKMHQFIKAQVKDAKVLYGGSVKPENITEILTTDGVDGVLVGGASIDPNAWEQIVQI